jgi:uncharacterized membrane protein YdjX (TVP38/TMEM64 family)
MSPPIPDLQTQPAPTPAPWRSLAKRFAPLAALLAIALVAYWAGLPRMLSPAAIGREQAQLHAFVAGHPALSVATFVVGYAVLIGACLPVALMLSLVGGLVFGPWLGGAAVLVGATTGAVITYAAARSAFAPMLVSRAERDPRLQRVIQGFGRSAFAYTLTLRFIPVVPFALVNLAAGLAAVPLRAFALATLAGGAPTALIYAGLGSGLGASLGSEQSLHQALQSPRLLLPLAGLTVLALAPLLVKGLRARSLPKV